MSGLDVEKANACLLTMLFRLAQEYPSGDTWYLAARATESQLIAAQVVTQDEWNIFISGLAKMSEVAKRTSMWPKGFF